MTLADADIGDVWSNIDASRTAGEEALVPGRGRAGGGRGQRVVQVAEDGARRLAAGQCGQVGLPASCARAPARTGRRPSGWSCPAAGMCRFDSDPLVTVMKEVVWRGLDDREEIAVGDIVITEFITFGRSPPKGVASRSPGGFPPGVDLECWRSMQGQAELPSVGGWR